MSTIDQLKRIDSACVAFEQSWNTSTLLNQQTLQHLAQAHRVHRPAELLVELLQLEWHQLKAIDSSFEPDPLSADWAEYPEVFAEALVEYQAQQKLATAQPRLSPVAPLTPGTLLGPYQIAGRIGAGGMGDVYAAEDTRLGRTVAIKILASHLTQNPIFVKRFAREAAMVARLSHPNIVTLFDLGEAEVAGQHLSFVVMEFLEGETLREQLEQQPMPIHRAVQIAAEIAAALDASHRQTVVHRDIKPENIFLTADGRVKILDFGLARLGEEALAEQEEAHSSVALTHVGTVLGTTGYMAPEQVRGETATAASDLFSLTCVLFEMLTGQRAFTGDSRADLASATLRDEPMQLLAESEHAQLPPALVELLQLGLNKQSHLRMQSAHDYSQRLAVIAADITNAQLVRCDIASVRSNSHRILTLFNPSLARSFTAVATSIAILLVVLFNYGLSGSTLPAANKSQTIAVLPFSSHSDIGGDSASRNLTLALTDELASDAILCVRPYSAVSGWHWDEASNLVDDPRIERLKVDTLVTGQIALEGSTASVRVELVNVAQGRLLWSHNYSIPRDALTSLHHSIRSDIARQLGRNPNAPLDPCSLALHR